MTSLWWVVVVLGISVALLYWRLYRVEKLLLVEQANIAKLAGAIGAIVATCPGYKHSPAERTDLIRRVRELAEDGKGIADYASTL